MKKIFILTIAVFFVSNSYYSLLAQITEMVKDINNVTITGNISQKTNVNGTMFFVGNDGVHGIELWKSDGTTVGTVMVKDIMAGDKNSNSAPNYLTNLNGTLYFSASDGINGTELWKSDGTASGTVLVKDIWVGSNSTSPYNLININGILYFFTYNINGYEIWRSDGTEVGTSLVKNLTFNHPSYLTNINGTLYFSASDGINGTELWKSDGTAAGTVLVKDIQVGSTSSSPSNLINVNGTLYFNTTDGTNPFALWKSDGTAVGTVLVKNFYANYPANLTNVNGTLYFRANDGINGAELWKSDGTVSGTTMVKDIYLGSGSSSPGYLTNMNGILYFYASDINGGAFWKSDGTAAGTVLITYLSSGVDINQYDPAESLTNLNGILYFSAKGSYLNGYELWKSDGTAAGTVMVKDILVGPISSSPNNLLFLNGTLYFSAINSRGEAEFWKSDGTEVGTIFIKNIGESTGPALPPTSVPTYNIFTNVNGTLYFNANDGINGYELWKSDGTGAGTVMVSDISPGSSSSYPSYLTNVNSTLFFAGSGSSPGLWKSDGTATGTVFIENIGTSCITNVNGTLFFVGSNTTNGDELWKSNGTAAGTVLVKDIWVGSLGSLSPNFNYSNLINVNGTLYFSANDGVNGPELWKSDGTAAGTIMVKDIWVGSNGSLSVPHLTNVNGTLFFVADDGTNGSALWKSDGTAAGTVMVKDIYLGPYDSYNHGGNNVIDYLTNVNGTLYFMADNGTNGQELWKSDGTGVGTVLVKDIQVGSTSSSPSNLINVNGTLFFKAYSTLITSTTTSIGAELWKSDGTAVGTVLVKDIYPGNSINGSNSSAPFNLTNINGTLFFVANDGVHGPELWKSDGTVTGTVLVKDISPSNSSQNPYPAYLTDVNGTLFFGADDSIHGLELWKSTLPACPSASISILSGDWNTASTWQCGAVPTATNPVEIQSGHIININNDVHAKSIKLIGTGKINYTGTVGKLFLNQ